jgi:hypothetical protein
MLKPGMGEDEENPLFLHTPFKGSICFKCQEFGVDCHGYSYVKDKCNYFKEEKNGISQS